MTAPSSPRDDMDEVLNSLMPFAQQMLDQSGEFFPFAASMTANGDVAAVGADVGGGRPNPREVAELLYSGLAVQAISGEIKASGVCVNDGDTA
jgi:hypothetical protein